MSLHCPDYERVDVIASASIACFGNGIATPEVERFSSKHYLTAIGQYRTA